MVLNIVQWTNLFHRINSIVLNNILPSPSSAPPAGAGTHHSFLPERQVLGLPPVAVAAKLECQPIRWQTSSSPRLQSVPGPRQTAAALLGTLTRARAPHVGPRDGSRYL